MLTKNFPFLLPCNVGIAIPTTLRCLADDLERVRAGTPPSAGELANAPLIVDWRCVLTPVGLSLAGFVAGGQGRTVASMVMSVHHKTRRGQRAGNMVVPADVLAHAMDKHNNARDSQYQSAWQVPARFFDLARDESRCLPATIRKDDRHQCSAECC